MKQAYLSTLVMIGFLPILLVSCGSQPSTVCEGVSDNQMCFNYQTSSLTYQQWSLYNANSFRLYISNEGNEYESTTVIGLFTIYDGIMDSVPQKGIYKGVSSIGSANSQKQFKLDINIDGETKYTLNLGHSSTLEITGITGETLTGTIHCYLYDHLHTADQKELYIHFNNLYHQ